MRLTLLTMPMGDLSQPYTSLPTLAAQVRPRGVEVEQHDYGIDFARYWMAPGRLELLLAELEEALAASEERGVSAAIWEDYVDLKMVLGELRPHASRLESLLDELRAPELMEDLWRLRERLRLLAAFQSCLSVVDRRSLPGHRPFQRLSRAEGVRAMEQPPRLYQRFVDEVMLPHLTATRPDVVGMSVTYPRQLFPTLLACAAIRRAKPGTPIVLGGAYLSTVVETFLDRPELHPYWDYVVDGEGDTALPTLLEAISGRGRLADVPNLVYVEGGTARRSERRHEEDIHALPTPDFGGLNLDSYLAPYPIFLLPVARGCYMRCTFCAISYATQKYRCRTGEQIVQDIRHVQRQFGPERARHFNFSIDVMTPPHLHEMARAIHQADLGITWDAEIRFDKTLRSDVIRTMREAGCRHLRFGLESAVDRVREVMDKRIQMKRVTEILDDCRREDIKASTMCIVGFPGETEEEAEQTFQFLRDNRHRVRFFALSVYTVSRGSIIAAVPERFRVELHHRAEDLVQPSWDFTVHEGIRTERSRQLVGEFRSRLAEAYPLADEGFSVGIGGAFTFLVSARWSWEDLLRFDEISRGSGGEPRVGPESVLSLGSRVVLFDSPYAFDGQEPRRAEGGVSYVVSPRHRLLRLEEGSAQVLRHVDGRSSVRDIASRLLGEAADDDVRALCAFLSQMHQRGIVQAGAPAPFPPSYALAAQRPGDRA